MPLFIVAEDEPHERHNHRPIVADTPERAAVEYAKNRYAIGSKIPALLSVVQYGEAPTTGYLPAVAAFIVEVKPGRGDWEEIGHMEPDDVPA